MADYNKWEHGDFGDSGDFLSVLCGSSRLCGKEKEPLKGAKVAQRQVRQRS